MRFPWTSRDWDPNLGIHFREWVVLQAGLVALLPLLFACSPGKSAEPAPVLSPPPSPSLPAVVDLHLDTPTASLEKRVSLMDGAGLEASLALAEAGGVTVLVEALWIPRPSQAPDPRAHLQRLLKVVREGLARAPGWILARSPREAREALAIGKRVVVLALESASCLTSGPSDLRWVHEEGVRMVGPTWTAANAYADSSAEAGNPPGLTSWGRELVAEAHALGLMVDVSHLSDRALEQALEIPGGPVLASHSNARSLCPVPRNLTDAQARRIGQGGGLIGVMFHAPFVCGEADGVPGEATPADVLAHVTHLLRVTGSSRVGFGSDLDGKIKAVSGLHREDVWPGVLKREMIRKRLPEKEIGLVMGESFLAFWERVEAASKRGVTP